MSLTIDYITMPPKSQEVSQIQHGDQVRYEQSQQEVASQVQQQVQKNSHQTIRRTKAENKEYNMRDDERRRRQDGSGGRGKRQSGETSKEENKDPKIGGRFFDMKI